MIRISLLLMSLPFAAAFSQSAPINLLVSSPNAFMLSNPATDSGRGPIVARGRLEYAVGTGEEVRVRSMDSKTIHVDAVQNGRVIASGDGAYVAVHREGSGVAIEARSEIPPSVTPDVRKPK